MKKLTFLVLLFSFFISTQAQVTITQSNVESLLTVGTTITTYVDTISTSFDIGSTGQSSWDFSGHPYQTVIDIVNIDPSTSPVANRFTAGNYATYSTVDVGGVVSESWVHVSVQNNIYSDIGTHSIVYEGGGEGITTIEFNPPEIIYQLPLTYGSNWSQSGTRDFEIEIFGFKQVFSVDYSVTRTIDAYGTLTMPDGTTVDVLRVKTETSLTNYLTGFPVTTNMLYFTFISPNGASLSVYAADENQPDSGTIDIEEVNWNYGSGATSVEQQEGMANSFSLAQNYPNPFNPTTTIQYSIPEASHVSLKVFDVLGKEVAVLVNQEQTAGIYTSNFDASNLTSGIYFYTLNAGDFTATKKLMLVK